MARLEQACGVCGGADYSRIHIGSWALSEVSRVPDLHSYENWVCHGCGVISTVPQITSEKVVAYYKSEYRRSPYRIEAAGKVIEPPIQIPWSGVSFQRFRTFAETLQSRSVRPSAADVILDIGGYQGMFLYGAREAWGCRCVVCDYSDAGVEFARRAFGFEGSFVVRDLAVDPFPTRARFVSMVHVFEHLPHPVALLRRIRDEVLEEGGYLYLEVPNPAAHPLDDPTHVYMYVEQALRFALAIAGFRVISMHRTGWPEGPFEGSWGSSNQNIVCLAQADALVSESSPSVEAVIAEVKAGYRELEQLVRRRRGRRLMSSLFKLTSKGLSTRR